MDKTGYKTSEFWITAIITIATLLNQSGILGSIIIPIEGLGAIAGVAVSYIFARGAAKKSALSS